MRNQLVERGIKSETSPCDVFGHHKGRLIYRKKNAENCRKTLRNNATFSCRLSFGAIWDTACWLSFVVTLGSATTNGIPCTSRILLNLAFSVSNSWSLAISSFAFSCLPVSIAVLVPSQKEIQEPPGLSLETCWTDCAFWQAYHCWER